MLQLRHWKVSLTHRKSLRHSIRLLALAPAILFINFNAHATPQAEFSLSVNPPSLTINPGGSATATVTITRGGMFTDSVTLDAFEAAPAVVLPNGVTITFSPASTTGNTTPITSLSVTIVIQRTQGLSVNAAFNTLGGQISQNVTTTPTTFVYQFNLTPGQTLQPGANRAFAAQTNGAGTTHPTSGDTATITYTAGGVTRTETRTF